MPKVFIASPSEVAAERDAVAAVVRRFNGEFNHIAQNDRFEAVRWEDSFYTADRPFQAQIDDLLAPCEVVIGIVGMGLGTRDERLRPSPEAPAYPSATAYEILSSIERARRSGSPAVYVFFKDRDTAFRVTRPEDATRALETWRTRQAFFSAFFDQPDRSVGAYQTYGDPSDLAAKVEDLLRRWTRTRYGEQPLARWSIREGDSPFPGLEPFDARHAAVYCGRNRKVARAIDLLVRAADGGRAGHQSRPFLLIFGPSGAGKSSLMRAGIAPRVTQPGFVEGVAGWRTALTRPGDEPFRDLARALLVAGTGSDDPGGFGRALPELADVGLGEVDALSAVLERVEAGAAAGLVEKALDRSGSADASGRGSPHLLLLVDQLEELLTERVPHDVRESYAKLLARLADTRRVWIVATLRADLYGRLIAERSRSLIALADKGEDYALAPPGDEEIDEIVRHSAELAGLAFEAGPDGRRLDERILADAAGGDALPLLQFTLSELFKQRRTEPTATLLTISAYESLGGVDGAIETRAESAVSGFGPAERHALERLFRNLVVPVRERGHGVADGRTLALRTLPVSEALVDDASRHVVEKLLQVRILQSLDGDASAAAGPAGRSGAIKVAHERVLESWSTARAITARNWDFFGRRADIEAQREVWEANDRSPAYLIQAGRPAADAARFAEKHHDELAPDMRAFIGSSRRRWRTRRALTASAWSLAVLVMLGLAGYGIRKAYQSIVVAGVAKNAVGTIATTIGEELSKLEGIQVRVVTQSLRQVDRLVVDLRARLEEAGDDAGDKSLGRSRAAMLYYFAKALQLASDLPNAETAAAESLALRLALRSDDVLSPDLARELADVHDLLGDIERRPHPKRPPNFSTALANYRAAMEIREAMQARSTGDGERNAWRYALAQSHVRIGDVFRERPTDALPEQARRHYRDANAIAFELVLSDPGNDLWKREMSYVLRKLGLMDMDERPDRAGALLADALCLRRAAASRGETEWSRDVGFSLMDSGQLRMRTRDRPGAYIAYFESLALRRRLNDGDPTRPSLEADVATTLHTLGAAFLDEGRLEMASFLLEDALERRSRLQTRFPDDLGYAGPSSITRSMLENLRQKPDAAGLPRPALVDMRRRIDEEADGYRLAIAERQDAALGCLDALLAAMGRRDGPHSGPAREMVNR